jgi:D-3-phosphoglycerate dehydrogenase
MVDQGFINRFQKPFYLVNTARGQVVNTAHLVEALKSGKIPGAALDVLEYEKLSFEGIDKSSLPADFRFLADADNIVLSPHIAGWTHESEEKMATTLAKKIKKIIAAQA